MRLIERNCELIPVCGLLGDFCSGRVWLDWEQVRKSGSIELKLSDSSTSLQWGVSGSDLPVAACPAKHLRAAADPGHTEQAGAPNSIWGAALFESYSIRKISIS